MLEKGKTYDQINREERAICSHLFRLLHHNLSENTQNPFSKFISILDQKLKGTNNLAFLKYTNKAIYSEVALIRDYYEDCDTLEKEHFLDNVIKIIDKAYPNVCSSISDFKKIFKPSNLPHPRSLISKLPENINLLNSAEKGFYKTLQAVFNAKPDLVLTVDNFLLVGEAKFTEGFKIEQLKITALIAEIWATHLFSLLGFKKPPTPIIFKLGKSSSKSTKVHSDITWEAVLKITNETYHENDRTLIAINAGVEYLNQ